MIPFRLKKFRLDPATASAPFVTTLVDVTGLIIYFSIAVLSFDREVVVKNIGKTFFQNA